MVFVCRSTIFSVKYCFLYYSTVVITVDVMICFPFFYVEYYSRLAYNINYEICVVKLTDYLWSQIYILSTFIKLLFLFAIINDIQIFTMHNVGHNLNNI